MNNKRSYDEIIFGIISFATAIIGLCTASVNGVGLVCGIGAIVLGIISRKKKEAKKAFSIIGIALGAIDIPISTFWLLMTIYAD